MARESQRSARGDRNVIVCRVCGYNNPDTAQFCENCKSFLEFTGERTDPPAGTGVTGTGAGCAAVCRAGAPGARVVSGGGVAGAGGAAANAAGVS